MAGNRSRRPNASGSVDPAKVNIAPGSGVVAPLGTAAPASGIDASSRPGRAGQAAPSQPAFVQGAPDQAKAKAEPSTTGTEIEVRITLVCGGLTNVKAPIVVGARYDGLAFAGPTKPFDRSLDMWLTRAVDLGIIGSALGQLFPIELEQFHKAGKLHANTLLLAGMGEPGRFAQDSLRFIFSNIIVMIKTMGENEFASSLLGTRRRTNFRSTKPFAAFCKASVTVTSVSRPSPSRSPKTRKSFEHRHAPLSLVLVDSDLDAIIDQKRPRSGQKELEGASQKTGRIVKLTIGGGKPVKPDPKPEEDPIDVEPDAHVNYLRVTEANRRRKRAPAPDQHRRRPGKQQPGRRRSISDRRVSILGVVGSCRRSAARSGGQHALVARPGRSDDEDLHAGGMRAAGQFLHQSCDP